MDKYLMQQYGLFGSAPKEHRGLTGALRAILAKPVYHYLLFGAAMLLVGFLSAQKILPYSLQSGLATTFAFSIAAVGFCLLMGYSGLASLGTGGFIGIGCYAVHYIMGEAGLPFIVAAAAALLVAIALGVIVGFISLRIEGIYLVIMTLGLSEIDQAFRGSAKLRPRCARRQFPPVRPVLPDSPRLHYPRAAQENADRPAPHRLSSFLPDSSVP